MIAHRPFTITGNDQDIAYRVVRGNDTFNAGARNDTVQGGVGNNSITGGTGNDILTSRTGNDLFI